LISAVGSAFVTVAVGTAHAEIFRWEYVNPADPSQGKRASATLCPDGAGLDPLPGSYLDSRDLTRAFLPGANLAFLSVAGSNLTDADLSHANLTHIDGYTANFHGADLSNSNLSEAYFFGADFVGADISGAVLHYMSFDRDSYSGVGGITPAQLYSTASYQNHDLQAIGLNGNSLAGVNLSGQSMYSSGFYRADLTGADFTNANLTAARFYRAQLTGANFSGATIQRASFIRDTVQGLGGLSFAQLSSTASYQLRNLNGINLSGNNYAGQDFSGQDLSYASLSDGNLDNANLSHAKLTGAYLALTSIIGANFTGAEVRSAFLPSEFTAAQLTSTASYLAHDLSAVSLSGTNLNGVNFAGQNLTNAYLFASRLAGADFTGANIHGATFDSSIDFTASQLYTTASYQTHALDSMGLSSLDFAAANFAGQSLTNATLSFSNLTSANLDHANLSYATLHQSKLANALLKHANLSGAILIGADLTGADLTDTLVQYAIFTHDSDTMLGGVNVAQLYATASYHAHELQGVGLAGNNLADADFRRQNLAAANFTSATLTNADFSHANLVNTYFSSAQLAGTNFTAADTRGADSLDLSGADATNTILPDGHVRGLHLTGGQMLVVHNYFNNPIVVSASNLTFGSIISVPLIPLPSDNGSTIPQGATVFPRPSTIPLLIENQLEMDPSGILRLVFDGDDWNSIIAFAPGASTTLGGKLDLEFDPHVNANSQLGRTFHIIDWSDTTLTGSFVVGGPYIWDLSQLYTVGNVTLSAVPEPTSDILLALGSIFCFPSRRRIHHVLFRTRRIELR
jgi:uncharacterized protein YjbI with pentapeptide repeats